jgi:hypothetical protein
VVTGIKAASSAMRRIPALALITLRFGVSLIN